MNRWVAILAACCLALGLASAALTEAEAHAESAGSRYIVTASLLNVRSEPSLNATIIGRLVRGDQVEKMEEDDGWFRIRAGRLAGWVYAEYLKPADEDSGADDVFAPDAATTDRGQTPHTADVQTPPAADGRSGGAGEARGETDAGGLPDGMEAGDLPEGIEQRVIEGRGIPSPFKKLDRSSGDMPAIAGQTGLVLGDSVRIRTGPGLQYDIQGYLNRGDRVAVIEDGGEWFRIETEGGLTGWMAAAYVRLSRDDGADGLPLRGRVIVVDPGHGGNDPGTIGTTYGTYEKTVNLSTSLYLKGELELLGATVILTRTEDDERPSLDERVRIADRSGADAFISIHYNSSATSASGILTFYYDERTDKLLAAAIEHRLDAAELGLASNGLAFGNFHVLRENGVPSVLLELGFLSNERDETLVRTESYQMDAARAVARGIADYFSG